MLRKRVFTKSPVRENRTPGSVRGLSGDWQSYRDQLDNGACEVELERGGKVLSPESGGALPKRNQHAFDYVRNLARDCQMAIRCLPA